MALLAGCRFVRMLDVLHARVRLVHLTPSAPAEKSQREPVYAQFPRCVSADRSGSACDCFLRSARAAPRKSRSKFGMTTVEANASNDVSR